MADLAISAKIQEIAVETTDKTMAATIAANIFSINKPGTTKDASHNTIAFITNVKRPSVKKLTGVAKNIKNGLINVLIKPKIMADSSAVMKLSTPNPGTR